MIPQTCPDEETLENDVRYGIADCRKRLRNQRVNLRTQHHPPTDVSNGDDATQARNVESFAEIFANVSMNQSSLSKLVEFLLGPGESARRADEEPAEREEAVLT